MATITHKVVRGDTLWALSRKYGTTVDAIAKLNNIKNPNLIYVGQVLTIKGGTASVDNSGNITQSTASTPTVTTATTTHVNTVATITQFGLQSNTDRTIFAVWTWNNSNTDKYIAKWWYDTGDNVWFVGSESNVTDKQSIYTAPTNAKSVKFQVKPVSKTYESNNKQVSYWTASWSSASTYTFDPEPLTVPGVPAVSLYDYTLTSKLENLTMNVDCIEFQIIQNDKSVYKTGQSIISTGVASFSTTIAVGNEYKVRCRSKKGNVYSEWSNYSANVATKPSPSSGITKCVASSETSVALSWSAANAAKTYDIEYATNIDYLGASNATTTITGVIGTNYIVTGLTSGETYFFRVRAVNDNGSSDWSGIKATTIGTKPEPPTTWSSTTTVISGESVVLYWMHNSKDNSKERQTEIQLSINGETRAILLNISSEDESEVRSYVLNTNGYSDATKINWRVRTKGAIDEWGDWSVKRSIEVFTPPTLMLSVTNREGDSLDVINSFPFYIQGIAGPVTQKPISYHVTITANDSYECFDDIGNNKVVLKNEEVYSKFYDVNQELLLQIGPDSVDLENGIEYTVKCVVTMNTGLTCEETVTFGVSWEEVVYPPNAEITFDPETLCTHIHPYCHVYPMLSYRVAQINATTFERTDEIITGVSGESISYYTKDYDDIIYQGEDENGQPACFCIVQSETPVLVEDVTLSVYRRDYDGKYIEIASGLSNGENVFVTDPHPSLDYARYRIVVKSNVTGAISYSDIPSYYVGVKSVIIQWNEEWDSFEATDEPTDKPAWSGSMLKLPYNIDISDTNDADVSRIEYIGRMHPVSYYGTQLGVSSTWNVDIPKDDKNTLYGLRRLAVYMGDVYVREPSGSGYWANISVSFNQKHNDPVIPVTFDIRRVEGGI